ncbi:hypothetical protein BUALT_Bualt03G0121800 [Buddleja alternifolia]|uniref:Bifunctional inhibitor/plant lipid transfer protein/seed storage helical domain-containing protein n=1 Tax=Buddleja alternifolia TaxID=168488 RepID=A0AAV6XZW8_9LAMI|nr:hypothetical protein BUALT_Bualt03G0121800 [Buddleja alternifolia]
MAKLVIFAALFAVLVAIASATTYTTVVTTTMDEENPRQSCQQEIKQQRMQHCMQWMMQMGGRSYETPFLRSAVANPRYQEEHLQECCQEMGNIRSECRCDAIKQMVMRQQEQMEEEMQEMMRRKAESLPRMCKWQSPTECPMRALYF